MFVKMVKGESYSCEVGGKRVTWTVGNPIPNRDFTADEIRELGLHRERMPTYDRDGNFKGDVKRFEILLELPKPAPKPAAAVELESDDAELDALAERAATTPKRGKGPKAKGEEPPPAAGSAE